MRRQLAVAVCVPLLLAGCLFRKKEIPPFDPEGRRLGIVMPFSYAASDPAYAALTTPLADKLTRALFDTKRLRVIDRQRLDTTLAELKLPVGVPLDSSQIATVCKQLKAEVAVYGAIPAVQHDEARKGNRVTETLAVTVEAKLVLAATAEVLSSGRATGSAAVKYREGSKPPAEVLHSAALADASAQVAQQLVLDLLPK